jgi:MFS family permease
VVCGAGQDERTSDRRWWVVLGCFLGLMMCYSPVYQISFGAYLRLMSADLGWSRGSLSLGPAIASLASAAASPLFGWWVDRSGARPIALFGCVTMPVAIALLGFMPPSYAAYLLVSTLIGFFGAATFPAVYLYLAPQYFDCNLGLAISLSVVGLGVGQVVMPQLNQALIAVGGWRGGWIALGAILLVGGVVNVLLLIRDRTPPRGGGTRARLGDTTGYAFRTVTRKPSFWLLSLAFLLISMVTTGVAVHLPAILVDRGLSASQGVAALSMVGIGSIIARLSSGAMLDRFPVVLPAVLFLGGQALGCVLIAANANMPLTILGAMLVGAGLGAESDLMPFILRRAYGMRAFGRTFGLSFTMLSLGTVIGPGATGLVFDRSGSYTLMLVVFAASGLTAAILISLLGSRRIEGDVVQRWAP